MFLKKLLKPKIEYYSMRIVLKSYEGNINKLLLIKLFSSLDFFGAVLVPFFTEWGGISYSKVLLLQSWFMFWIFFLEIPTGAIADYFGRKQSVILGKLLLGISLMIYSFVPNFYVFLLSEFLFATSLH